MADDHTIVEGTVKFRDGKKWKSRWCVMRKLSPVADCVHLQVYRDAGARRGGAASKAALSLQRYLGCESGFTLDKHSHTLALLCADFTAVLAFESRERLVHWQLKVGAALGESRAYLVVAAGGRLPPGPARLHLLDRRFALVAGSPPRPLGVWELAHLRRFGVVDGKFCFEGGSLCGRGEGLHVLVSDRAADILADFELASRGQLSPKRRAGRPRHDDGSTSPKLQNGFGSSARLELPTIDQSLGPSESRLYEEPALEDLGVVSPCWPAMERSNFDELGLGDTASVNENFGGGSDTWSGGGNVTLERCVSCMSKLGALSRSSTAALTPGAKHFSPAWTMEEVSESRAECAAYQHPKRDEVREVSCRCRTDLAPQRPPKTNKLELTLTKKPPMPPPVRSFSHAHLSSIQEKSSVRVGPYENYDVPKVHSAEVEEEYYDTPKRLKECINSELFKVTKSSTPDAIVLKKPCGCLLKLGQKFKRPIVIEDNGSSRESNCPCQKVTAWANSWIRLPYCRGSERPADPGDPAHPAPHAARAPGKENTRPVELQPAPPCSNSTRSGDNDCSALYATVDFSRKTRRKSLQHEYRFPVDSSRSEIDDGPLANYENLNFALSLEHYENAKDLLKKAGVTQRELDALGANLKSAGLRAEPCARCGHGRPAPDDYLVMEPNSMDCSRAERADTTSGYTPMSPISGFAFHTLKHPVKSPIGRLLEEKSASNPTLCGLERVRGVAGGGEERREGVERRKRSSSADSSRFLDDVHEPEGGTESRGSASSIETLRDRGAPAGCGCTAGKHSDAESSESSKTKGQSTPAAGNRDSSSSNDSGVSSWSLRGEPILNGFELPATTAGSRRRYRSARREDEAQAAARRSRSVCGARPAPAEPPQCRSAEAAGPAGRGGAADAHSTSSGTSDMSDYIETLSLCSSHSSSEAAGWRPHCSLRPRSGCEYAARVLPAPPAPHCSH